MNYTQQLSDSEVIERLRALYVAYGLDLDPVAYLAEIHRHAQESERKGWPSGRLNMTLRGLLEYELDPLRQFHLEQPYCGDSFCPICKGVGFLDYEPGVGGPCQRRCNTCMPPAPLYLYGIVVSDDEAGDAAKAENFVPLD